MKTVKVHVAAGPEIEEARRTVEDVLELLNRHFRTRGVEFVSADGGEGDWTIALYWKDFGGMAREEFETVYEEFKKEKRPIIHVFFKEPDEGIGEALKAFKEAFAERYGHFYCHFETVDAVRFQLVAQSLSMLPGGTGNEKAELAVEDGVVRLGNEPVAKMANLSFAKLNAKRKSLVRQIAAAEAEVAGLEEDAEASPEDADLQEALREARVKRHDLEEELKQHDGFLFNVAVSFAKATAEETSERTRKAWELFQQGKVQEANKLLDWDVLKESAERNRTLFRAQKEAFEKNLQEYLAKAKIVMADDSMTMTERVDAASRAYDEAIAIAREIHWEDAKLAEVLFDYAFLLDQQRRFQPSIKLYEEALEIRRRLADGNPRTYEPTVAHTLNNLAVLHSATQRLVEVEAEYVKALVIYRRLAAERPETYESYVAGTLDNLANLHQNTQQLEAGEAEYVEALEIYRCLAAGNLEAYESYVAGTLNNLAVLYKNTQRLSEAEAEFREALEIYRRLARTKPEAFEPDKAMTLNNLANLHNNTQRQKEAETEYGEALETYRQLAAGNPEKYEPEVAMTLNNLATFHCNMQQTAKAAEEFAEALEIRRRLAAAKPEVYEAEMAATLCNMARLHEANGCLRDAVSMANEALETFERCAERAPGRFEDSLDTARVLMARLGKNATTENSEDTEGITSIRVYVSASEDLEEIKREVMDLLALANRHFRSRGVELLPMHLGEAPTAADWVIALYGRDFGQLSEKDFETAYQAFKKERKPKIYMFFKEPMEIITDALKAFRDSFAEKYGHFYCHFETVEALKFQLVVQFSSVLPWEVAKDIVRVEDGVVHFRGKPMAKMEDLPLARSNAKRMSLARRIAAAEKEVAGLEEDAEASSEDADLQEALREAREKSRNLKKELELCDGFLVETVLFSVRQTK